MTNNLDSRAASVGERAVNKAYLREFLIGMIGYAVILMAVMIWGGLDGDSPWRYAWAVLPVVPMLWVVVALWRHIKRIDDYQRLVLLRGLGIGFAVAMISAITLGMLGIAGLSVPSVGWIIFSLGMAGWLVATTISNRK
ncbi:MAG: hypothetical protein JWQ43_1049 [Glaciihabitans sp.]|nr:hypothetical protein [Glaciihabitans sp.]